MTTVTFSCWTYRHLLLSEFWPGGPLCFVDFHHFARFADQRLDTRSDLPADLDGDKDVDLDDLKLFIDE